MEFFTKYKKIFLVIGFILIVFILGYLLYTVFFRQPKTQPSIKEPIISEISTGLPQAKPGTGQVVEPIEPTGLSAEKTPSSKASSVALGGLTQINALNETPSLAATLSSKGDDLQYYNKTDEKFYRINKDGQATLMEDKVFHQVESVIWSPNKNKAILEYPDGTNVVYDFDNKKQITLPAHWKDFNFAPDGSKLVMKSIGLDPDNRWLAVVNEDGSRAQQLEPLGDKDKTVYPLWSPNNQTVAMFTEGVDFDRQEVYFVGLHKENFKSMVINGRGFQPKWTPDGNELLYSVYSSNNNFKPTLWVTNAIGDTIGNDRRLLNIETWAEKCVFANAIDLYCAVPNKLEEGSGIFEELSEHTKDNLYKINIKTGSKKLIATTNSSYNMSNLIISSDSSLLYFTDKINETLHKVNLK